MSSSIPVKTLLQQALRRCKAVPLYSPRSATIGSILAARHAGAALARRLIAINTTAGVRNVDPTLTEMARSFGARESELFLKIILPAAMPMILAGIRLGMGRAVLGMVTGEMILAAVGFGAMLMTFSASFNSSALFATILTIVLLAVALLALIQYLDRRLMPWRVATQ